MDWLEGGKRPKLPKEREGPKREEGTRALHLYGGPEKESGRMKKICVKWQAKKGVQKTRLK